MKYRPMTAWPAFVLILLAGFGRAVGQTGSIDPTSEQIAGMTTFAPPEITFIEEPVVDLRRWLPPVGEQKVNDCTAWAMAYAAKSYAEARDQGWRPDAPARIFSPTFVYNQINDGRDEGSNFVRAILLMREQGVATLATAPYSPRDFTRAPSDRARREAAAFPIHDGRLIDTRVGIRRALQRRHVVVFGANVNPVFLSGRFDRYTQAMFERDHQQRRPNQRHGKHAMVIVGYDDTKEAFLIQNSWGTQWNQRGYCWIAYEVFDTISLEDVDKSGNPIFCNWAVALVDVEEPIEYGEDGLPRARPMDLSTLRASGFSDFIRFDKGLSKFLYGFSVELRGQVQAMEQVEQVTWNWTDPLGRARSMTATNMPARFGIRSSTTLNPMTVTGEVRFKDGSTRTVREELRGPIPRADFREAKIVFDHALYEAPAGTGKPTYMWEMGLDYPLNERDDIVKVVWDWGKMGTDAETSVTYEGVHEGVIADRRPVGFASEPDTIKVEITYADGGVKRLEHTPVFDAEIIRDVSIDVETRQMARDHLGRMHYAFTLKLKRPRKIDYEIDRVIYEVDAHVSVDRLIGHETLKGCPVTGATHRDFRVKATVEYRDGRKRTLERLVELGPDTAYPDPNRVELIAYDTYLGSFGGGPTWQVSCFLVGDPARLPRIERVTWTYPESTGRDTEVAEGDLLRFELATRYMLRRVEARGPVELAATVRFDDGSESRLRLSHTPRTPVNESLGIRLEMSDKADWYFNPEHQQTHLYNASLVGSAVRLAQIVRVAWYHQAGGRQLRAELTDNIMGMTDAYAFAGVATEPFELMARIEFESGFEECLTVMVTPGVSIHHRPPLRLQIEEKFHEYDDQHRPQWIARLNVVGDAETVDRIERVFYVLQRSDSDTPREPVIRDGDEYLVFRYRSAHAVTAMVRMKNGASHVLSGLIRAYAPRPAEPMLIRHDPIATGEIGGVAHWVRIDGWESLCREIHKIDYRFGGRVERVVSNRGDTHNLGIAIPYGGAEAVTARVELHDGRVYELEQRLTEVTTRKPGWTWEQGNYWGDGMWEVHTRLTGPLGILSMIRQRVLFQFDGHAASFEDLSGWPIQSKRVLLKPGRYNLAPPRFQLEARGKVDTLEPGTIEVRDRLLARVDALQVFAARSPARSPTGDGMEWQIRLRGPEREMVRIERVRYRWSEGEESRDTTVTRRWGEFYDGFEHRYFGEAMPLVGATVHFRDGSVMELSNRHQAIPGR